MAHALHDPVRHNAWATTQNLEFCRGLDEQTLNATVPGTYGTIIATLRHIIYCEIDFLGHSPTDPWQLGETTRLDALMEHAALLATDWEVFLASDVDSERPLPPDEARTPSRPGSSSPWCCTTAVSTAGRSAPSSARSATSRPTSRPGPTHSPAGGSGCSGASYPDKTLKHIGRPNCWLA
jgi:hypothetical protein